MSAPTTAAASQRPISYWPFEPARESPECPTGTGRRRRSKSSPESLRHPYRTGEAYLESGHGRAVRPPTVQAAILG
ncbi:hypothetical protein P3T39_005721 [Kitasatospora sp. GP82]|nr:hypothetical protein [Kitasatospora sp. GP82]